MKRFAQITVLALCLGLAFSCQEIDIAPYSIDDSAVCFSATSSQFSMKGVSEDWITVQIPVTLIGPSADFDRDISIRIADAEGDTAVEGRDFEILSHSVPAGALGGYVEMKIKNLDEGVSRLRTTLEIVANENFQLGYPAYVSSHIEWSEEYVRPEVGVWRYWYLYFCHGYSRRLHQLIVDTFGEEIETYTGAASYAKANPSLVMKMPTWWYEASRILYKTVRDYDSAHPEEPLRHSDDFQSYSGYSVAVGEGTTPEVIPTIFETLETL